MLHYLIELMETKTWWSSLIISRRILGRAPPAAIMMSQQLFYRWCQLRNCQSDLDKTAASFVPFNFLNKFALNDSFNNSWAWEKVIDNWTDLHVEGWCPEHQWSPPVFAGDPWMTRGHGLTRHVWNDYRWLVIMYIFYNSTTSIIDYKKKNAFLRSFAE